MGFQVYKVEGFEEPWWFDEDWYKDVVSVHTCATLEEAARLYQDESMKMQKLFPKVRSRVLGMVAFWQPGQLAWCEPCANDEQVYYSLVIFEDQLPLKDARINELANILNNLTGQKEEPDKEE